MIKNQRKDMNEYYRRSMDLALHKIIWERRRRFPIDKETMMETLR